MDVHDKIRTMRQINQWTQEDMADKLNISVNGYAKLENGKTKLNLEKLQKIAQIFNIDLIELISSKERTFIGLIGDNNHNISNYLGTNEELAQENEKLKLVILHKEELLQSKSELITKLTDENNALKEIIELLKKKN